jgi:hypothetical protein
MLPPSFSGVHRAHTLSARRATGVRWLLPSLSTHASNGATGRAWLVEGGAETRDACTVAGRAPRGVMLLGTTQSIAEKLSKVQHF